MTRPTCVMSQEPCDCVVEDPVSVFENEKIADEGNAMALSLLGSMQKMRDPSKV